MARALLKVSPREMPESNVHSFIVKLWLEEGFSRKGMDGWHGQITHVPSGERRYLKDLRDIVTFIKPYIGEANTATWVEQLRRWLSH
jgi:hypothetical protein